MLPKEKVNADTEQRYNEKLENNNPDDNLVALIDVLQSIDTNSPLAKLNATSMPDNNGGRITF
jgi:hypothetical protein